MWDAGGRSLSDIYRNLIAPITAAMKSRRSSAGRVCVSGTVMTTSPLTVVRRKLARLRFKNR